MVVATVTTVSLFLAPASGADPALEALAPSHPPASGITCSVTDSRITEASGMAVGADRLYLVNDGGDRLTVFVLDRNCRTLQVLSDPTDPYDVEDLAREPDGTLWFADTGDNREVRDTVALESRSPSGTVTVYRFSYPDGAHDTEALLLERSGRPFLVTKNPFGQSGVYTPTRTPSVGEVTPLRKVTTLRFRPTGTPGGPVGVVSQLLVTGGAVSPDGTRLAVRTYTDLYLWTVRDGDIGEALRSGHPTRVALPEEKQGESVAFTPDGRSVLTTSEGLPAPVHQITVPPPNARANANGPADRNSPTGATDPAGSTATLSPSAATQHDSSKDEHGSRPVYVNLLLAAIIATVIVIGLGRLRRK